MCMHNLKLHSYVLDKWQEQHAASQHSYFHILLPLLLRSSPVSGLRLVFFMFRDIWCFMERGCQPFTQSPTWRTIPPYLWLPETRWPSYTARHWVTGDLWSATSPAHSNWAATVHTIPVNHSAQPAQQTSIHSALWLLSACHKFIVWCHTNTDPVQRSALLICFFAAHHTLTAFIRLVGHLNPSSTRPNLPAKKCLQYTFDVVMIIFDYWWSQMLISVTAQFVYCSINNKWRLHMKSLNR
jgi:hypothetical protein